MLGNFKTQVRNIFGNAGMQGVRAAKDLTAASLEKMYSWVNPKAERTKTAFVGKDLMEAAKADYVNVEDAALGEGKYKEGLSDDAFARGVEEKRSIFKNNGTWGTDQGKNAFLRSGAMKAARTVTDLAQKPLEGYRNLTNLAMTQGDVIFTKHYYARALAGYLKANKITAEQFSSPVWQTEHAAFVDKARQYAIKEAQEATFRDSSLFSNWVSQIGQGKKTPKPIQVLSEGLAPFRKTPANVLVRAEEYSPLGFANTIYEAVRAKRGNATSADVINSLSKSLTGTALFAVGMALFKGLIPGVKIRGGDDDNDKQRSFDDLTGRQAYSIELPNGFSMTLDWLAPGSMPFFMGVELEKLLEDGGLEWKDLKSALTSIAEPMLQMSMLQSVNDTLDNLKFSEDNLGQLAVSLALNYLTQGLTNSLVGQAERISEEERQSTYVDRNSAVPSWLQREIGKASAKTPGWDYHQIPYLDAWGREEETGDALQRAFNNLANPAYVSQVQVDQVERELQRLKDATGNGGVFPDRARQYFTVDGQRKDLTAEEYQKYAKTVGQAQFSLLEKLMEQPGYQRMDDTQRQKAIAAVYEYASGMGKLEVSSWNPDSSSIVKEALKSPLPTETYILYRVFADRDGNGSVSGAESAQTLMGLDDLTDKQRGEAWDALNDASEAKNPFTGALSKKLEPEDAMAAWGIYDRKGTKEEPYTQERKKEDLQQELGLSYIDAAQLYELMKNAAKGK